MANSSEFLSTWGLPEFTCFDFSFFSFNISSRLFAILFVKLFWSFKNLFKFLLSILSPFLWFITGVNVSSCFCFSYICASIFSKFFFFLSNVFLTFSSICSLVILFVTFFPIFSSNKILATSLFSFSNWSLTALAAIFISFINCGFPSSCSIWNPFLP